MVTDSEKEERVARESTPREKERDRQREARKFSENEREGEILTFC